MKFETHHNMKKIFLILSLIPILVNAQYQPDPDFLDRQAALKMKSYEKLLKQPKSSSGLNYDMKYGRYFWIVDPAIRYIRGSVTTYFEPTLASINEMSFDMTESLSVDSIVFHNTNLTYTHTNDIITIAFSSPVSGGATDSITVFYQGDPAANGFGSFTQDFHGDNVPIIWTLSEPYGAHDWMPCKESLSDKIDSIDVFTQTPTGYKTGSNGVLISETINGDTVETHWKHRHPIVTYLVAFAVTNYAAYSNIVPLPSGGTFEVLNYVYPESLATAQTETPRIVEIFDLYHQFIIEYPFKNEKYGHAQCGFGGGMEHQTMSFMGDFGHELMAHELMHQWFGDYITCGSWKDLWLNEGFATFFHGWTYEHMFEGFYWNIWKEQQINKVTQYPSGSVYCYDTTDVSLLFSSRLRYSKGAMILHMLRWEIGDSAFFAGINNYLTNPLYTNKTALTPDIIQAFETAADTSLTDYFNDWCYNEGYPIYNIQWWQETNNNLHIVVNQSQSHPSVSFFKMHLPFKVEGATDTLMLRLHNTTSDQHFIVPIGFSVSQLKFNSDFRIVTKNSVVTNNNLLIDNSDNIAVFPNPINRYVSIKTENNILPERIEISDITGKIINEFVPKFFKEEEFKIDVSYLRAGVYFIKIISGNKTVLKKIVKE